MGWLNSLGGDLIKRLWGERESHPSPSPSPPCPSPHHPLVIVRRGQLMRALAITYRCNIRCPGCYAHSLMGKYGDMTLEGFRLALDWLASTGVRTIKLMGGEPTVHPLVERFLEEIAGRGWGATVYTNGLFSATTAELLSQGLAGEILVNLSHMGSAGASAVVRRNLRDLVRGKGKVSLHYIMDERGEARGEVLRLAEEHGCSVTVLPLISSQVGLGAGRGVITDNIFRMVREAWSRGVPIMIITPLPRCALGSRGEEELLQQDPFLFYTRCSIGYGGDYAIRCVINPDLTVFPCPAVFLPSPPLPAIPDYRALNSLFRDRMITLLRSPPYQECLGCDHHRALVGTIDESRPMMFFSRQVCSSMCLQNHHLAQPRALP